MHPTRDIAHCISLALEKYFHDLDGESPAGLHAMVIKSVERPLFEHVLKEVNGNQTHAAKILGINRNTLRRKLDELNLS
jgi:Fis family transcriptional regulator